MYIKSWIAVAVAALAPTAFAANLIKDGSFELAQVPTGTYQTFESGEMLGRWKVVGPGRVALVSGEYVEAGVAFPAFGGAQWLDLTGAGSSSPTGVEQTVATTPGKWYSLSFRVGNVNNGSFGTKSKVRVRVNGERMGAVGHVGGPSDILSWGKYVVQFVATSTSTTITLLNGDGNNDNCNGLDSVAFREMD